MTFGRWEKREKDAAQKESKCNNMANVWLKLVIYSNNRREKKYSELSLITVIASYIDSQLACIACSCFNCMRLIYNTIH